MRQNLIKSSIIWSRLTCHTILWWLNWIFWFSFKCFFLKKPQKFIFLCIFLHQNFFLVILLQRQVYIFTICIKFCVFWHMTWTDPEKKLSHLYVRSTWPEKSCSFLKRKLTLKSFPNFFGYFYIKMNTSQGVLTFNI
jgi:hypothetical protein